VRTTTGLTVVLLLLFLAAPLAAAESRVRVEEVTLTLTPAQVERVSHSLNNAVELTLTSEQLEIISRIAPGFDGDKLRLGIDHLRRGDRVVLEVRIPDDSGGEVKVNPIPVP
jgi:hypothetical protein